MKQRDTSIDILKFIAVLAITNSHMELLYGKYSALATGGTIGDVLFFFASGFTLFLGVERSFGNYYKRRIGRIYPTVFAWAVLSCLLFQREKGIVGILLTGGGWFVSCIMIYYVALYFVRKACFNHLRAALAVSVAVSMGLYWLFRDGAHFNMYGNTYYKWVHYFSFMLQGCLMGVLSRQRAVEVRSGWLELLKAIGCAAMFYALCAFKGSAGLNWVQTLSLLPLLGVTHYVYRLCNAAGVKAIYHARAGWAMRAIGGLCLEVYLVQNSLFTDKLNSIFPFNILVVLAEILAVAYALRCLGRIWSQTFKEADYDWKEVFKIV